MCVFLLMVAKLYKLQSQRKSLSLTVCWLIDSHLFEQRIVTQNLWCRDNIVKHHHVLCLLWLKEGSTEQPLIGHYSLCTPPSEVICIADHTPQVSACGVVLSLEMPRFTVHVRDEWLTIPCKDATCSIKWLGFEALKRYIKNKPDNGGIQHIKDVRFVVRRCQGLGLLDNDDIIEDVLEDNDFVELGNVTSMAYLFSVCREVELQTFSSWLTYFIGCLPQLLNPVLQDELIMCYFTVIFSYWRRHHATRFHSKSAWDVTPVSLYCQSITNFNQINCDTLITIVCWEKPPIRIIQRH